MSDWEKRLSELKGADLTKIGSSDAKKPEEAQGSFSRGFETAMRQLPQTAGGAVALAGDLAGMPAVRQWGLDVYKGQEEKIQALGQESDSFSNVMEGTGSLGEFLKYGSGYVIGQAGTAIGAAGIGAAVGRQLVKRSITEKLGEDVAKKQLARAAGVGAMVSAGTLNLTQEAGSIYPEALAQADKEGRELTGQDKARIVGSAVAASAVDTVTEMLGINKVLKGSGASGGIAKRAAKEVPIAMVREGATEGVQTGIERFGAGKELGGAEATRDYVDSVALGALGGSMAGAAASIRQQKQPEVGVLSGALNTGIESQAAAMDAKAEQFNIAATNPIAKKEMQPLVDAIRDRSGLSDLNADVENERQATVRKAEDLFRKKEFRGALTEQDRQTFIADVSIAKNPTVDEVVRKTAITRLQGTIGPYVAYNLGVASDASPKVTPSAATIATDLPGSINPSASLKPEVAATSGGALPAIDEGAILDKMSKDANDDIKDQKVWDRKGSSLPANSGKIEQDRSMQNRDRSKPASVEQMKKIANDPDYDRLGVGKSPNEAAPMVSVKGNTSKIANTDFGKSDRVTMGDGSKIAVRYAVVEANDLLASHSVDGSKNDAYFGKVADGTIRALNNGRAAALKEAYARGTSTKYRTAMYEDAAAHGVSPASIDAKENPVLVRVYDDAENDRSNLGELSNPKSNLGFSDSETALNDARSLDLTDVDFGENNRVDSAANQPALDRFAKAIQSQGGDSVNVRDAKGKYTGAFLRRFKNAVFAKAYRNQDIVEIASDEADPDLKNVLAALSSAAPDFAKIDDAGDLEIRPQLVDAARKISDARSRNLTLEQYTAQGDMLGQDDLTEELMRFMWANQRSPKRLGDGLKAIARFIDLELKQRQTINMFGDDPADIEQIKNRVNQYLQDNHGDIAKIEQTSAAYQSGKPESVAQDGRSGGQQSQGKRTSAQATAEEVSTKPPLTADEYVNALIAREQMPLFISAGDQLQLAIPRIIRKLAFREDANDATKKAATEVLEDLAGWIKKGSVLAAVAADHFKTAGSFDLIGSQIRSAKDLAMAAQVLRDSRFETLRYIFVKDGKVIGHTAVSSRLPSATNSWPGATGAKRKAFFDDIGTMSKKSDGYYLLHNHPSGDPTPSEADVQMTIDQAARVPGFLGHVVIDTNRYAEIGRLGEKSVIKADFAAKETDRPGILSRKITSKTELAKIGSELKKPGYVTLIAANAELKVNAAMEIPVRLLTQENTVQFKRLITNFGLEYGAGAGVFLAGVESNVGDFAPLVKDNFLIDVVDVNGFSLVSAGTPQGKSSQLGRKNTFAKLVMQRFNSPDLDLESMSNLVGISKKQHVEEVFIEDEKKTVKVKTRFGDAASDLDNRFSSALQLAQCL